MLDDVLKMEGFGAAEIDNGGAWLVYERIRPYDQFRDYSFRSHAQAKTGHQLWRLNLKNGGIPERLPGLDPEPHSYLQGFSPTGRHLMVMQYRLGDLSIVSYDMAQGTSTRFHGAPAFSKGGEHNPIWISHDEFVYAALPDGVRPALASVRASTGQDLMASWKDAWRGDVVTSSEVRTIPVDLSHQRESGYLVLANAMTGSSKVLAEGLYADLRLDPTGRYLCALAVYKSRNTNIGGMSEPQLNRHQLTLFDLTTGKETALAPEMEFFPYTITWSPDGQKVSAYGWRSGEGPRRGRFYVVDVRTGAVARYDHEGLELVSERERGWVQRPERTVFLQDKLVVFARKIPQNEDQAPRFNYQDYRPTGLSRPDWYALSQNGAPEVLTNGLSGVSGIPLHAANGHFTVFAQDGVYRLYASGAPRNLTPAVNGRIQYVSRSTFATSGINHLIRPDFSNEALLTVSENGRMYALMVDLRDGNEGKNVVLDLPLDNATPLAGVLGSSTLVLRSEEANTSRLLLATADGPGSIDEVARINEHLADIDLGDWKIVSYQVEDPEGKLPTQRIESCVLMPPGHHSTPPPLIVDVYPNRGPSCKSEDAVRLRSPNAFSGYLWAARGYAYASLTLPRELIRTHAGPIAGMGKLVDTGVDALVEQGFADPGRIALYGFSQGGVSALYVAAHSSRFKAVIAMNSWSDFASHYFGPSGVYSSVNGEYFGAYAPGYDMVKGGDFGIGFTPFEDPEIYYRNSPMFLAPQINAPVLLVHSDMDSFPISQFDQMYGALQRVGKDARYVRYWGEGHGPSSPANIQDMWKRFFDFLSEKGVAPQSVPLRR